MTHRCYLAHWVIRGGWDRAEHGHWPSHFYDKDFERWIEPLDGVNFNRFGVTDKTPGITPRALLLRLSWLGEAEYEDTFAALIWAYSDGRRSRGAIPSRGR